MRHNLAHDIFARPDVSLAPLDVSRLDLHDLSDVDLASRIKLAHCGGIARVTTHGLEVNPPHDAEAKRADHESQHREPLDPPWE